MKFLQKIVLAMALTTISVATIATTGCVKKVSTNVPAPPKEYRVTQSIAILVESNKAATQAVIQLNKSNLLDDSSTASVLKYTGLVAQTSKDALTILDSSKTLAEKQVAIANLFATLNLNKDLQAFIDKNLHNDVMNGLVSSLRAIQLIIGSVVAEVK